MTTQIHPISAPAWLDFISYQENANIFHHPAWVSLLADCYSYRSFVLLNFDERGQVDGGIPLMDVHSRLTGHRWISLPFSDYCTPLCSTTSVMESLLGFLLAQYRNKAIPSIQIRSHIPTILAVNQDNSYVLHSIKLLSNPEALLKTFDKTRVREPIRQAMKRGVEIRRGTSKSDIFIFYKMLVSTRHRHGSPVQPKRFFSLLWDRIIERGMGFLLLAYKDDEPIGGTIYVHYGGVLTAKYNASLPKYWNLRANNSLYWSAIKWGCEHGFTSFDFGRTEVSNQTLRDFKSGWGSVEEPLVYSSIGDHRPKHTNGFLEQSVNLIIRNSPPFVCRFIGEIFYKHYA